MPILLEGLRRLEYRGYDSCGVAVIEGGAIRRARSVKRVQELAEQVEAEKLDSTVGIAHTRWATHGGPVVCNAHPHIAGGRIALVHNGIIENYAEIREELLSAGVTFESQTDTEVLAHLVNHYYEGDLLAAVEQGGGETGTVPQYNLRYLRVRTPLSQTLVFADMTIEKSILMNLARTCVVLTALGLGIFLAIAVFLARWMVQLLQKP